MSQFLRLLNESDKGEALLGTCAKIRQGGLDPWVFEVEPSSFKAIPGEPFAYWVSDAVRGIFSRLPLMQEEGRSLKQGLATADDFRFVRLWWEPKARTIGNKWWPFAKGGKFSRFYADLYLVVNWSMEGVELYAFTGSVVRNPSFYFRPGLTWPNATTLGMSTRILPRGTIFGHMGPSGFIDGNSEDSLTALISVMNTRPFAVLVEMQLALAAEGRKHYEVGVIQKTPVPDLTAPQRNRLANLARTAWSLKRTMDTVTETSHVFVLPAALRSRLDGYNPSPIKVELADIQAEIDNIAFDLYDFSEEDRQEALPGGRNAGEDGDPVLNDDDQPEKAPPLDALFSWAAGVAFGRFDWRLATGEREAPPEPEPFDPLPAKSPGMLSDGDEPYHRHGGILVDDPGHDDLPRLMADVLETVDAQVDEDLRRWVRRDFFKYHLQQYSKSRRKAPIYWPLATASGSYTLWLYYPDLTDQTLFTAVNDFVEPKLKQVDGELANLRLAGASRSRADEKRLEELSDFRDELADLRDTLLRIAPSYKPSHDDGVQITAAPLWPLFRHKPWQKVLKETWEKLEQGDYDWAHLAMAYWPERVIEKCVTDKSLAIAHDLEHLYVEPEPAPKKTRGRKKSTGSSE